MASDRQSFEVYLSYLKMKNYFNITDYSFESNIRAKPESFLKRKDRYFFMKLADAYPNIEQLTAFLLSSFLYDKTLWVGKLLDNSPLERYHYARLKNINSINHLFEKDVGRIEDYLLDSHGTFLELLKNESGYSLLLDKWRLIGISLETLCLIDNLFSYTRFHKEEDLLYEDLLFKVIKYRYFLKPFLNESVKSSINHLLKLRGG